MRKTLLFALALSGGLTGCATMHDKHACDKARQAVSLARQAVELLCRQPIDLQP